MTDWNETLIENGRVVRDCFCREPERRGHYHPMCKDYCLDCNYDRHMCPGCGTVVGHDEQVCLDCEKALAENGGKHL